MKVRVIEGQAYRLPDKLSAFQLRLYVHLIDWKWAHITREPGTKGDCEYDTILPTSCAEAMPLLYPDIVSAVRDHARRFPFRQHLHFNHMASSQAANLNLFLPILLHPAADAILAEVNPHFARLATEHLDWGWRVEYWDEPFGVLNDKPGLGTDADLATAYYDHAGRLCLWLIEHKLTETEFTTCGGYGSSARKERHDCKRSFAEILADPHICYYHNRCHYNYWAITMRHADLFANHAVRAGCPFRGGLNQLWRNQLLALAVEDDARQPFAYAHFSVVRHPRNRALDASLDAYHHLIGNHPRFSAFTSADIIAAAQRHADAALARWIEWYKTLYDL